MKYVIRKSTFETNSSSCHAFTFRTKDCKDCLKHQEDFKKVTDNYEKLVVLMASNQLYERFNIEFLAEFIDEISRKRCYHIEEEDATFYAKYYFSKENELDLCDYLITLPFFTKEDVETENLLDFYKKNEDNYDILKTDTEWWKVMDSMKKAKATFVKVYCELFNRSTRDMEKSIEGLPYHDDDCVACFLFDDSPLVDCDCRIEKLMEMVDGEKIPNYETLAKEVFNDNIALFYREALSYDEFDEI